MYELNSRQTEAVSGGMWINKIFQGIESAWHDVANFFEGGQQAETQGPCSASAMNSALVHGSMDGAGETLALAAGEDAAGGGPEDPVGDGVAVATLGLGAAKGAAKAYAIQRAECAASR